MDKTEIGQLIDDTLYGRAIASEPGSCLSVNTTGLTLLEVEHDILSRIEKSLNEVNRVVREGGNTPIGLNYVVGGYLLNGARNGPLRVVVFMDGKAEALIEQFLGNMAIFFKLTEEGRMYGEELPTEYAQFVKGFANSNQARLKEVAIRTMNRLGIN